MQNKYVNAGTKGAGVFRKRGGIQGVPGGMCQTSRGCSLR